MRENKWLSFILCLMATQTVHAQFAVPIDLQTNGAFCVDSLSAVTSTSRALQLDQAIQGRICPRLPSSGAALDWAPCVALSLPMRFDVYAGEGGQSASIDCKIYTESTDQNFKSVIVPEQTKLHLIHTNKNGVADLGSQFDSAVDNLSLQVYAVATEAKGTRLLTVSCQRTHLQISKLDAMLTAQHADRALYELGFLTRRSTMICGDPATEIMK